MNVSPLHQALGRSGQTWTPEVSHIDAEQAFLDRTALAAEVRRLQGEITTLEEELRDSEREIVSLESEIGHLESQVGYGSG